MNIDAIKITSNIIVVAGPTASGKTDLAVLLALKHNGEVINGDAFQVYKGMNIGTGKIKEEEKMGVVHHLFDIIDYKDSYDVKKYQTMAREVIADIHSRGKTAIICGGSTLYVQAVLYEYNFTEDIEYEELKKKNEDLTLEELQAVIKTELNNSDFNNHKRLVNIYTKEMLGIDNKQERNVPHYESFDIVAIKVLREELYNKINKRVIKMFESGLIEEVKQFDSEYISQQAIGYKEVHKYLNNQLSYEETIELVQQNSRKYAKRQMTWYNNQLEVSWYSLEGEKWIRINY